MAAKNKRFTFLSKKEPDHSSSKKDDVGKVFVVGDQQFVVEEIIAEGWFLLICIIGAQTISNCSLASVCYIL